MNGYISFSDEELFSSFGVKKCIVDFEVFFNKYFDKLIERRNRLEDLDVDSLDYSTYFEMALVQLRAIILESDKLNNNITIQNYLSKLGLSDRYNRLNGYLDDCIDNERLGKNITLRQGIKLVADKYIVHYDAPDAENIFFADGISDILNSKNHPCYLGAVVDKVNDILLNHIHVSDEVIIEQHVKLGKYFFKNDIDSLSEK